MKGHLYAKDLETYKKEDLEKLAEELGVSTEGTKKEIAARCAAVEVDIPDEDEQDDEQDNNQQASNGGVMVECVQVYKDVELNRIVRDGEQYEVTPERAAKLLEANLVKRV